MSDLVITLLTPADSVELGRFFEELAQDAEARRFFHPHPLTMEHAAELCRRQPQCRDRYYLLRTGGAIAGYAMLRGWDEGHEVPSFGVCLHPKRRSAGYGQRLLLHAIRECRAAGAPRLRLTVYKDNHPAVHIYRKFGFVMAEKNDRELVGMLDLSSLSGE